MNVLFVSNRSAYFKSAFGGAETSLKLIAEELANRGHSVIYITKNFNSKFIFGIRTEIINKVKVVSVNFQSNSLNKKLKTANFLNLNKYINEYQSKVFTKKMLETVKDNQIEIVYCFYEINIINKLINLQKCGLPLKIVMRMAGNHWYEQCEKNPKLIPQYEYIFNSIDSVNFIHDTLQNEIDEKFKKLMMHVHFKHSFIGDIGTSTTIGRPVNYVNSYRGDFQMIMAGRFTNYPKRQDILVHAMKLIPNDLPIKLTLIGEGERKRYIEEIVDALELKDKVTIEPFCQQRELWSRLLNVQLLCHACEFEGLGKMILESMALGVPLLVSNVEPLNKNIVDGVNGFLVENEPIAWANKIVYLYHNQELLDIVSRNSIKYIRNNYDPKKNIHIYEDNFKSLIN